MSPKPTKPCDLYIRVSRVNGRSGDSFISPELQETQARGMAAARGIAVGRVITDLDQSGGKMDRPGLNKALARIRARESGGIIVARLDRFARTLVGALDTLAEIEQAGGVVVAADGEFDTSTSNGRFMSDFMLRLHQYYREQVAERWVDSQTAARARGVHITARVPFGYKRNGNGTLAQSEDAALVKEIFTRRARGESWQTICDWLDLQGARTPMLGEGKGVTGGGNRWTESSLRKLVQNP